MNPAPDRLTLRDFEIIRLLDGTFRVDGGAMFGVVPRTWPLALSEKLPARV